MARTLDADRAQQIYRPICDDLLEGLRSIDNGLYSLVALLENGYEVEAAAWAAQMVAELGAYSGIFSAVRMRCLASLTHHVREVCDEIADNAE